MTDLARAAAAAPSYVAPPLPTAATWVVDRRHGALLAFAMGVLIVLMIVPENLDYGAVTMNGVGSPAAGGPISRALWLALLALSLVVLAWRPALAWLLARTINPFLLLFVVLALASIAWSIDAPLTTRRMVRLITIVTMCAAFVLTAWHERRIQVVVRPVLTAMLAGSLIFGMLSPELAIHQETAPELLNAWRGLANHKNSLGALASFGLILWLHGWLSGQVGTLRAVAGGAIGIACLVLSRSSTALAACCVVLVFLLCAMRPPAILRRYVPVGVVLLVGAVIIFAMAVLDLVPGLKSAMSPLIGLTGKDMTFTGRTAIWAILSEHIRLHPLFGTGYGAYWVPAPLPGTDSYAFVWHMGAFYPGSAHNGYLEVLNDLGWAGLACLIGYILVQVRQGVQLLAIEPDQANLYLALLFQQALTNVSETHWFASLSVDFVLTTLATLGLARALLDQQLRQAFGGHNP